MDLFRVFDWDQSSLGGGAGGPLFVARNRQGSGRHDAPALYGAWYCTRAPVSAVAECIQYLRGHTLSDDDFRRVGGTIKAVVGLRLDPQAHVVDLDDSNELAKRHLRPSHVATLRRSISQRIASSIFHEGAVGLGWWSTLEAEWPNVTLYYERALARVSVVVAPRILSVRLPEVRQAAEHLGIDV